MHKKGNSLLESLFISGFYLVLAVIIFLILYNAISPKNFSENYIIRDVGLTLDTLHNSPGKTTIVYSNMDDLKLTIKESYVEIRSLSQSIPKIYSFVKDQNYRQLEYELNFVNSNLKINKEKNYIYLELETAK